MKKSQVAFEAWKAATAKASAFSVELEAKGEAVTVEDNTAFDALIATATDLKKSYERLMAVEVMEEQAAEEEKSAGRKTRNGAPAVLPEGARGQSKGLKVANIWKATMAAGAGQNPATMKQYMGEELEMSDRLKAAGYQSEYMGSVLVPLGAELLVEPLDERGQKLADFSSLRKEIRERMELKVDPGELAWMIKNNPALATAFGLSRKDLAMSDDTLGGYLIPNTQATQIIDLLRAQAVFMQAGAQQVALPPSGNLSYPRLTSDPNFSYADPDMVTDAATTNIGTGVVRLAAKSLRGFVTIPNDLMRYSSPSVEMVVRGALAAKAALAEDNAFLENPGSSLAPKGLINYTAGTAETVTVGRMTLHIASTVGANGDTLLADDIAKMLALYYMANDPAAPTAWMTRPLLWAAIQNRRADAVTAGDQKGPYLFPIDRGSNNTDLPTRLGNYPVFASTQASNNRTKGSATNLTYAILGNFKRAIVGRVGVLELSVSEHVKFLQDKTIIRAVLRNDLGLTHEESFVFCDTLLEA